MNHFFKFPIVIFIFSLASLSCSKDPKVENQEELITTLVYTLVPQESGETIIMTFKDLDGDGGANPIVTVSGSLLVNKTYNSTIKLTNESVTPNIDITQEVKDEAVDHQFFYTVTGGLAGKMAVAYDDKDSNNNPLGIQTKVTTSGTGTGKMSVTLRHEPNKSAAGVAAGSINNAGGETDIEVSFDVIVK